MQRDLEGYETGAVARDYVRTAFAPHDWLSQELQRKEREHGNKYDLHLDLIHSIINEFKQGSNPLLLYFDLVKHLGVSTLDLGRGGSKAR